MTPTRREVCTSSANRKRGKDKCWCQSEFVNGELAILTVRHGLLLDLEWLRINKFRFSSHGNNEFFTNIKTYFHVGAKLTRKVVAVPKAFVEIQTKDGSSNFTDSPLLKGQKRIAVWHGTNEDCFRKIMENGFRIPTTHNGVNRFGRGLYFSTNSSYAAQYCYSREEDTPEDYLKNPHYKYLMLCYLTVGKSYTSTEENQDLVAPPRGFDTVKGLGRIAQSEVDDIVDSNGIIWPAGEFREMKEDKERMGSEFDLDEYVAYDNMRVDVAGFVETYMGRK